MTSASSQRAQAAQAQLLACGGVEILRNSSTRILPVVQAIVKPEEPDFRERWGFDYIGIAW
jgi:hypothetical protein